VEFGWAGSSATDGSAMALDGNGFLYTTGTFGATSDLDPTQDTFYVTTMGNYDIYIQKMDLEGNFIWAKSVGGTGNDQALALAADNNGNTYITGHFNGTADFDPGPGVSNLTAVGQEDIFILKLNSLGELVWVKQVSGTDDEVATSIEVDALGNVYAAGYYSNTVDFDPGPGVNTLTFSGSFGFSRNTFLLKLDAQGDFLWVQKVSSASVPSMTIDANANIYMTGTFFNTVDFDPGLGISNLTTAAFKDDIYILKLDSGGNFVWARDINATGSGNNDYIESYDITVDALGNVYTTGTSTGFADFDPGSGVDNGTSGGPMLGDVGYVFINKLDASGSFVWARIFGGTQTGYETKGIAIAVDNLQNVYTTGWFKSGVDFDPNPAVVNSVTGFPWTTFFHKLDAQGNFEWAFPTAMSASGGDHVMDIEIDEANNVYGTGQFSNAADFDPGVGVSHLSPTGAYLVKYVQKGVLGRIYHDFDQSCMQNANEIGLKSRRVTIMPGNHVAMTNPSGTWLLDSLPVGNYTLTVDTSGAWAPSCFGVQSFTITNPDSIINTSPTGLYSTAPCPSPDVSIYAPFLRPGFSNQSVYVQACNDIRGTGSVDSAYLIITIDTLLALQTSSLPYSTLGNNQYRVDIGTINPNECIDLVLGFHLSINAILGQTLCMQAELFPVDSCALDDEPSPSPTGINPCLTAYDWSDLTIRPSCYNDTMSFVIANNGDGDMTCFSQVRVYIDGQLFLMDSIMLVSGDTAMFVFPGDGRTWRLEVDQHPLHLGNSQPNATLENCGTGSWVSGLVTILPQDDADPIVDIYCGEVRGSYDPNDKRGFPLGVGVNHDIEANQDLEYVIRFQNTGTDTAFTVVIRDTLTSDLDIFSVRSGVSSHDYNFRMYGTRVLEWTFNNIMLPDSNVNEALSHGFVNFKVKQKVNLPLGSIIQNSAAIYFDFNAPIITNTSEHTIYEKQTTFVVPINKIINENSAFRVYPNPTFDLLYVQSDVNQEFEIYLMDNLGLKIKYYHSFNNAIKLNLNHLEAGIYYLHIKGEGDVEIKKVIKL
jgi:uncharacterized repeat protein (TIGR01451 family)